MDNFRGAFFMVLSMLGFALEDMFIKFLAENVSVGQIMVLLGIGGSLAFGLAVLIQRRALFSRNMWNLPILLRAAGEMFGTIGFMLAIVLTSISSASAILQATPLVVTLGAALFLGEPVGWRRWSAILVGMIGVLFIIRPGLDSFEILSLLAVLGVLGLATRDLATRRVDSSISTMQLGFLGFLSIIPAGILLMIVQGSPVVSLSSTDWGYYFASILIGLLAYYAIVSAMRVGEVSFVTPFRFSRLIFALFLGVLVFEESPDTFTLLGASIIVLSGLYTIWRERRLNLVA